MDLGQRHSIKFLHLKCLKLREIATELFNAYGQDACARSSIKYWPHPIKLGRPISKRSMLVDDQFSSMLMLKFYHFCENFVFLRANDC
jgi:hypothetical protein